MAHLILWNCDGEVDEVEGSAQQGQNNYIEDEP